ncbi:hypothetical protein GIB67_021668 [Kingdonia uniflora]|uniref:Pentatricopeptide repeat-containing protein n=1 Tax=Kingdonia uniflora TaxID=39325 RepID=A0A7J7LPC9_9MAGN|nr:hypothetical protein GIB67_021668 [Kingdonia uniflora]
MMKLFERSVAVVVMKKKMISELHNKVGTSNPRSKLAHFEQFVRERIKSGNLGIEEAKCLFDYAIQMRPSPSILLFTRLLGAICKLRHTSNPRSKLAHFEQFVRERIKSGNLGIEEAKDLFDYSFFDSIPHFEYFVRDRCKSGNLGIEEAKCLFDYAIQMRSLPSIFPFTQLLGVLNKLNQYSTVFTLFKTMESEGIKPDLFTFSTLINCFCQMGKVDFGFAVVGNIFKNGFEADIVIFNTLLKGLFKENRVNDAIQLFCKITEIGYTCTDVTYGTMFSLNKHYWRLSYLLHHSLGHHQLPNHKILNSLSA